jgi:hypothetical protein
VERHIRLLTPLAFIPPRALAAMIDGSAPHDATVTALAQAMPYQWEAVLPTKTWSKQQTAAANTVF